MKRNTSGFTIVELLVVCVVIAILAGIAILAYVQQQDNSLANRMKTLATLIAAGGEEYYRDNGEYPDASTITSLDTASKLFNIPIDALSNPDVQATVCSASSGCPSMDDGKIYYVTRKVGDATTRKIKVSNATGCQYTFSGSGDKSGNTAFMVIYLDQTNKWHYVRSAQGDVSIFDDNPSVNNYAFWCAFTD